MPELEYSNQAYADLQRFFYFLAAKNEELATRAIDTIHAAVLGLVRMPKIGRPIDGGLRELVIDFGSSGYIALYDLDEMLNKIIIVAIKHQLEDDYESMIESKKR